MLDPKKYVAIKAIPYESHVGLRITARSFNPNYTCEYPKRTSVAKENYERRSYQLTECGYRSSVYKPYQEVGHVILDSKQLILETLQQKTELDENENLQLKEENNSEDEEYNDVMETVAEEEDKKSKKKHMSIGQCNDIKLSTIQQEMKNQENLVKRVKLGVSLFNIVEEKQKNKNLKLKLEEEMKALQRKDVMVPGIHEDDDTDTEDEEDRDLTRYIIPSPLPTTSTNNTNTYKEKCSPPRSENHFSNSPTLQRNVNLSPVNQPSNRSSVNQLSNRSSVNSCHGYQKKKFKKKNLPRPYSPIYTNVNFFTVNSSEALFRQLCAIHWILEAMSQDNNPPVMSFITSSWKVSNLKQDPKLSQKRMEREKMADPIWQSFLNNSSRFQSRSHKSRFQCKQQRRSSSRPPVQTSVASTQFRNKYNDFSSEVISEDVQSTTSSADVSPRDSPREASPRETSSRANSSLAKRKSLPGTKASTVQLQELAIKDNNTGIVGNTTWKKIQDSYNFKTVDMGAVVLQELHKHKQHRTSAQLQHLTHDMKDKFLEVKKEQGVILHDNLEFKERTRWSNFEKKFISLRVMKNVYEDLNEWRRKNGGVKENIETVDKNKSFSLWYQSLQDKLPSTIKEEVNINLILKKIEKYSDLEGRKISVNHFLRAMSILRPFELCHPDISASIEFVRDKIVEMDKNEFESWCSKHAIKRAKSAPVTKKK